MLRFPTPEILIKLIAARATFRVFKIERKLTGREDLQFLERVFQKLLLNFTWFVLEFIIRTCSL